MGSARRSSDMANAANFQAQNLSQSTSGMGSLLKRSRPDANNNKILDLDELPETFNLKGVKRNPSEACMLCEAPFSNRLQLLKRNPIRHCKRCGKSICEVCSESKRQLSRADPTPYRVCDKCDTEMDNYRLQRNHNDVLQAQLKKIEMLNNQIEQLDNDKQKLQENYEAETQSLNEQLKQKYDTRDKLNVKVSEYKNKIQQMNNARNFLHESICDLEKVVQDLEVEQSRLSTKQQTVMAQTVELQYQLQQKNIENEELTRRLEALKQKVNK